MSEQTIYIYQLVVKLNGPNGRYNIINGRNLAELKSNLIVYLQYNYINPDWANKLSIGELRSSLKDYMLIGDVQTAQFYYPDGVEVFNADSTT